MTKRGFTLIELLIVVVIIGILAAIAIPKFANTKEKAVVASMKSDLRNLVTVQESFYFDNSDYAGNFNPAAQIPGGGGAGSVVFNPSAGNTLVITYVDVNGYSAVVTNPILLGGISTCGVFVGALANQPDPAVTQEGVPACY